MNAEKQSSHISEMAIIREVNNQAEIFYEQAVELGDHAATVLPNLTDKRRSQMTNLETIAESTLKFTDVLDYIKKQTARHDEWRRTKPIEPCLGERLRDHLENKLKDNLDEICNHLNIKDDNDEDKQRRRRIHLLLIRQFIRQMVVEYEYQASLNQSGGRRS